MRRRDRPIDVFKKLPLVRCFEELQYEDEYGTIQKVCNLDELLTQVLFDLLIFIYSRKFDML